MLKWFRALMPKEDAFFGLFERHSQTLVAGAEALRDLLKGGESVPRYCEVIAKREHEADDITREVLSRRSPPRDAEIYSGTPAFLSPSTKVSQWANGLSVRRTKPSRICGAPSRFRTARNSWASLMRPRWPQQLMSWL